MWRLRLKPLRVAGALLIGGGLTVALLDFRDAVPAKVGHWLASVQFVPAAIGTATGLGLAAVAVLVGILILTLLIGRVYCSVICPLGVLQDVIARLGAWAHGSAVKLPPAKPHDWLRYGFLGLTLAGILAGWGGLTLALLDPYSQFGRIVTGLCRPLVVRVNNALVGLGEWLEFPLLYRVELPWLELGAVVLPITMLLLVGGLALWRGRLFCNTVCPVGTVLGLVARKAAWRLSIRRAACVKCGDCVRACKAQCIDLRAGTIDASRCVACFNCISACEEHGVVHDYAWTPAPAVEEESEERDTEGEPELEPTASRHSLPANPGRRTFLVGATAVMTARTVPELTTTVATPPDPNASTAVCPPGAQSLDRYLNRCTACHLCVSACPTHVLQPAQLEYGFTGWLRPRLDFHKSFCNYDCIRCGEVCPTGAIARLALPEKQVTRIGRAVLQVDLCVVKRDGTECAACSEHCPTKAVDTVPYRGNLRLPEVKAELCIGCGACEFACPVVPEKAIKVTGRRRHEVAEKAVEAKPVQPAAGDFPF
jgi:ferredoxin